MNGDAVRRPSKRYWPWLAVIGIAVAACASQGHASSPPVGGQNEAVAPALAPLTPALAASMAAGMPALPTFFVGVNVYDLAADLPGGYDCNAPVEKDAPAYLDQTFAALKAKDIDVVRFWAFQTYATADQTGERYWDGLDSVMAKGLQYGIYLIPVLDNHWRDCARLRPFTARLARNQTLGAVAWAEQFAERYGNAPAVYAIEVMNEPAATTQDATAEQALRDDLQHRVDAVRAHTDKPVGLGNVGEEEAGFEPGAFAATYAATGATIATTHDYQAGRDGRDGCSLDADQCGAIDAARTLGLTLYVGEGGSKTCDDAVKASALRQKLAAARAAGATGYLYWDFALQTPAGACGFDIGPAGDVIKVFRDF